LGSGIQGHRGLFTGPLQFVAKKGEPIPAPDHVDGLVVLDGTWSQAKTIWWRNPWLLKLKRAVLVPTRKSLYRELRKEPRRECLSTIESIALALEGLGQPQAKSEALLEAFAKHLEPFRKARKPQTPKATNPVGPVATAAPETTASSS
jgi:DTW domain-containing protein YfiP